MDYGRRERMAPDFAIQPAVFSPYLTQDEILARRIAVRRQRRIREEILVKCRRRRLLGGSSSQTQDDYNFPHGLRERKHMREEEERRMLLEEEEERRMILEESSPDFASKRRWKPRRYRTGKEELEEEERRMLEESSPDFASKRRSEMKPRRYRTRKEELEEEERRMIEDLETKILAGLPKRGRRERMMRVEEDFASKHQQHLILVHDSEQGLLGSAPPGPFKSVVCFSSFSLFVVGSVNGLICVAGRFLDGTLTRDDIWIFNPVTELSIKLPLPASPTTDDHAVSFAFSCFCDSEADSKKERKYYYKVFKVVCASKPFPLHLEGDCNNLARPVVSNHVEVWDSRSPHTWTKIKNVVFPFLFYHPGELSTSCEIVVEKVAFWIVSGADGVDLFLISINMETHAVKQISLPKQSNIPVDFLIGNRIRRSERTFLFGAIWEGSFALFERLGFKTMLYNVWAIDDESGGTSWIKKATFLVDICFHRFIGCVDGKLLVEQDRCVNVLFDMETRRGKVIDATNTFLDSAHHFVTTLESFEGFTPIQSFANCPEITIVLPNPGASGKQMKERVVVAVYFIHLTFRIFISCRLAGLATHCSYGLFWDVIFHWFAASEDALAERGNTSTRPAPGKSGSKKSSPAQIGASKGNTSTGPGKSGCLKPKSKKMKSCK